jgi:hypothetical protein
VVVFPGGDVATRLKVGRCDENVVLFETNRMVLDQHLRYLGVGKGDDAVEDASVVLLDLKLVVLVYVHREA